MTSSSGGSDKLQNPARRFFAPTLNKSLILSGFALMSIPFYFNGNICPSNMVLYPLVIAINSALPLIYSHAPTDLLEHVNFYDLFFTWVVPPTSLVYFYTVGCTIIRINEYGNVHEKQLTRVALVAILLAGLFALPHFIVPAISQALSPPPPKYITFSLHDEESCESLSSLVLDNGGDSSLFSVSWDYSTCILAGTVEIPYSYFSISIEKGTSVTMQGVGTTINAELLNDGLMIVDNGSFITSGMSNDGIIHVKKGATLDNLGSLSSKSGVDIDRGEVLPGNQSKIQIINEGTLYNRENATIENFGAIKNEGGTVTNEGEIISFQNTGIFNKGGRIENLAKGKIIVGIESTLENSDGRIGNHGYVGIAGTFRNANGATFTNQDYGDADNQGKIFNDDASITNLDIGKITNSGIIYNGCGGEISGTVSGAGPVDTCSTCG